MFQFLLLTLALLVGLGALFSFARRKEIIANWNQYRTNPIFMFSAFLYKPDSDPRSRFQFAADNFTDVIKSLVTGLFEVALEPVFNLLRMLGNTLEQNLRGIQSMRTVFANMWHGFTDMAAIFENRFALVLHQLRTVMFRLFTAFQRVTGVATSAVFSGLSALYSMLNFIDLLIKVIIVILVVLVILVIFFFFILAPFIPVILVVVGIISTTAMAGAVGGMAGTFCFAETTPIVLQSGAHKLISEIRVGDVLEKGATVTGTLQFLAPSELYDLHGVQVSGSHIVFSETGPVHVKDHPEAKRISYTGSHVYCLNTSTHTIRVRNIVFSDWEELSTEVDMLLWNRFVWNQLNKGTWIAPKPDALESEAGILPTLRVRTPTGSIVAETLRPGMVVLDATGQPTKVTGCVRLASDTIAAVTKDGLSAGTWILGSRWEQPAATYTNTDSSAFVHCTTGSGTILLESGIAIRDFTDVGWDAISRSYDWVLERL